MRDYESTDLAGAAYLAAEDDWDYPDLSDEDCDREYERDLALGHDSTQAFYPEWTPEIPGVTPGETYVPKAIWSDEFCPEYDEQDIPF